MVVRVSFSNINLQQVYTNFAKYNISNNINFTVNYVRTDWAIKFILTYIMHFSLGRKTDLAIGKFSAGTCFPDLN